METVRLHIRYASTMDQECQGSSFPQIWKWGKTGEEGKNIDGAVVTGVHSGGHIW